MKSIRLTSLLTLTLALTGLAEARGSHIVTTAGGVQRLAEVEPSMTRQRLVIVSPTEGQANATIPQRETGSLLSGQTQAYHGHHYTGQETARLASIPQRITSNAINTATRTTEQQLNNAIRREIRRVIQF